jgi:hypothetical protein
MQLDKGQDEVNHCRGELAAINVTLSSTEEHLKQATKERDRLNTALKQAKVGIGMMLFSIDSDVDCRERWRLCVRLVPELVPPWSL